MRRFLFLLVLVSPIFANGQGYGSEFKIGHSYDCHQVVIVMPRIRSLDTVGDSLKVDFTLLNSDSSKLFPITGLMVTKGFNPKNVFMGDSLVFRIENEIGVDSISFPYVGKDFVTVSNKKDRPKAKSISRTSEYDFHFKTSLSCYGGEWHYDPRYSDPEYRWLFTKDGYYAPFLSITYNEWVRNDHLEIFLNKRRLIDSNSFKIIDKNGVDINYELVVRRNPTLTILLNLSRDLKPFEKFIVLVSNTIIKGDERHGFYYKYPMNVGGHSDVGLGGKYNNLER